MKPEPEDDFEGEDMMSDEFWLSHGIQPITIDPNDESTFDALTERIQDVVNEIRREG